MIFIYGGGLSDGSKYLDGIYDGRNSARNQNHVLVTFNYRVGALGWLALAELQDESKDASLGNYGLMDQRAAFQWVQTNIANFGGDPDNVMIFGQSAGAMSVCSHMVSEASNGLFKHALMESGNCDSDVFYFKPNQNIKWGQAKVNASGCVPGSKNVLECMRKIPQGLVMNDELMYPAFTQSGCPPGWPVFTWGFTIDGSKVGLKDKPNALMKQGKINSGVESLVAGTNDNEGSLFLMELPNLVPPPHDNPPDEVAYDMMIQRFFGSNEANVKQIESMYDLDTYGTYAEALGVMIKHWFFACSTRRVVRYASDAGIKTFEYHFVYHNEWWDIEILGDYHSAELAFVLENPWPIGAHHFNKNDTNVASLLGG
jgi:para-nitrobenzyl esterase